jgi:HSP20 family protein
MRSLVTSLDQAVSRLFNTDIDWYTPASDIRSPAVDIEQKEDGYLIAAEMPGINKKDISISVENGVLTLKAERDESKKVDDKQYHYFERFSGSYKRTFKLTSDLDPDNISAEYKDGILNIFVHKKEKAAGTKIEIK